MTTQQTQPPCGFEPMRNLDGSSDPSHCVESDPPSFRAPRQLAWREGRWDPIGPSTLDD